MDKVYKDSLLQDVTESIYNTVIVDLKDIHKISWEQSTTIAYNLILRLGASIGKEAKYIDERLFMDADSVARVEKHFKPEFPID